MNYSDIDARAAEVGLAVRGGFHPVTEDGVPALLAGRPCATLVMLGWTDGIQWPHFVDAPEYRDGQPNPLDRWSRRHVTALADTFGAVSLFPFGGPPVRPFLRWAGRAEAVHGSPIHILIHPDWGLWHAWRGALAFSERLELPPRDPRPSPCDACKSRPCLIPADFDAARAACPVGTPYGPEQRAFHIAAFRRGVALSSGTSSPG